MTWQTHDLSQKKYDEAVITYDTLLTALIKVEILDAVQFRVLLDKLKTSGMEPDDEQLLITFMQALRTEG